MKKRKNKQSKKNIPNTAAVINHEFSTRRGVLKIVSWNIESRTSEGCSKFDDSEFLKNIIQNDIICLQETRGPVYLENHRSFNSNRENSKSGGVAILVKNELSRGMITSA